MAAFGSSNMFDLLREPEDGETAKVTTKEKLKKPSAPKPAAPKSASTKPAAPKAVAPAKDAGKSAKPAGKVAAGKAPNGDVKKTRPAGEGRGKRGGRGGRFDSSFPASDAAGTDRPSRGNRPPRGGGGDRGDRGDRSDRTDRADRADRSDRVDGEGKPRRRFDRHSGTGRAPTENKKGGGGRSNWGKAGDELEVAAENKVAAEGEEVKEGDAPSSETVAEVPEKTPEEIAEEKQITLEEYKKQSQPVSVDLRPKEQRKTNAGLDSKLQKELNKFQELKRDDPEQANANLPKKTAKPAAKSGKKPVKVNEILDIKFNQDNNGSSRGGRGDGRRGGRGGGRGGRGGAVSAPATANNNAISFDDSSFPSLGVKLVAASS